MFRITTKLILLYITLILIVLYLFSTFFFYPSKKSVKIQNFNIDDVTSKINEKDDIIKNLSILLNEAMNNVGKLSCEISKEHVSQNGGWCQRLSGKNSIEHKTDYKLARYLSKILVGKCVASFGDGPGVYRELILGMGEVKCYDAYDGAPFAEITTNNTVKFLDLSVPIYHLPQYDWILSMEVAEHIPNQFEGIYLNNLVRHAKEGIILSWARTGQKGHSHVNNQPFEHVKKQMELRGFFHIQTDSERLKENAEFFWFKANLNIYKKKNLN